jgi:hypothetical protein
MQGKKEKHKMVKLTEMEKKVLKALFNSSEGNGHDFGLVQECRKAVEQPKQLAGIMASLVKKGLIIVHGDVTTDSGNWMQTTWKVEVEEIKALLHEEVVVKPAPMRVYGNLMNRISEAGTQRTPQVGDGATINHYTDRSAGTIIEICSPKKIKVQDDKATRIDSNGMSESQDYSYERDPEGHIRTFTQRKNGMWVESKGSNGLTIGIRRQYHDFSF